MDSNKPREYRPFTLAEQVRKPSYEFCLDWMQGTSGPHASYDMWARGNFTRRLLHHRTARVHPLVVQVANVAEMRWAYRRLALLRCPIDFIYTGPLQPVGRILHLFPWDSTHDCGWGYVAALDPVVVKGRKWFTVLGNRASHARRSPSVDCERDPASLLERGRLCVTSRVCRARRGRQSTTARCTHRRNQRLHSNP